MWQLFERVFASKIYELLSSVYATYETLWPPEKKQDFWDGNKRG